jgi:putative sigma-54 modulation protein
MPIEITARHMNVTDQLQEYARRKAGEILNAFPKVEHVHVILDTVKRLHTAKIVVQSKNHIRMESEESAENPVAAIDAATEKTEKQLRRVLDKIHDHKPAMKHVAQDQERGVLP